VERGLLNGMEIPAKRSHFARTALLVWVLWLGIDFFAYAGLFAGQFSTPTPFLLRSDELFARIPLGYAAFLIYVATTLWLIRALGIASPLRGAMVAGCFGAAITIAGNLGVLSVSTIGLSLALDWTLVQVVEFAVAGYASVWVDGEPSPWRAGRWVGGITIALIVMGIMVQNLRGF
jgi:hypothetical protein